MKEFDISLQTIFTGLNAEEFSLKDKPVLFVCHNLEPINDDYELHQSIVDMNATDYDWNNPSIVLAGDLWVDDSEDVWADDEEDVWLNSGFIGG